MTNELIKEIDAVLKKIERWAHIQKSVTAQQGHYSARQMLEVVTELVEHKLLLKDCKKALQDDGFIEKLIEWLEAYWPESERSNIGSPVLMRRVIVAWIKENRPQPPKNEE